MINWAGQLMLLFCSLLIDIMYLPTVQSLVQGHWAEKAEEKAEPKEVIVFIEWESGDAVLSRSYTIPEPNKRFRIPDPHDPSKDLYITLKH